VTEYQKRCLLIRVGTMFREYSLANPRIPAFGIDFADRYSMTSSAVVAISTYKLLVGTAPKRESQAEGLN
jgi:hypothetical protein